MKLAELFTKFVSGQAIRREGWKGYWKYENGTVNMYCRDGLVIDIKDSEDILFTISNILVEDWVECDPIILDEDDKKEKESANNIYVHEDTIISDMFDVNIIYNPMDSDVSDLEIALNTLRHKIIGFNTEGDCLTLKISLLTHDEEYKLNKSIRSDDTTVVLRIKDRTSNNNLLDCTHFRISRLYLDVDGVICIEFIKLYEEE